eukprot:12788954-Prorocentrum_lima.AAC.1
MVRSCQHHCGLAKRWCGPADTQRRTPSNCAVKPQRDHPPRMFKANLHAYIAPTTDEHACHTSCDQ